MVLGGHPPGRVGRRRNLFAEGPPLGGPSRVPVLSLSWFLLAVRALNPAPMAAPRLDGRQAKEPEALVPRGRRLPVAVPRRAAMRAGRSHPGTVWAGVRISLDGVPRPRAGRRADGIVPPARADRATPFRRAVGRGPAAAAVAIAAVGLSPNCPPSGATWLGGVLAPLVPRPTGTRDRSATEDGRRLGGRSGGRMTPRFAARRRPRPFRRRPLHGVGPGPARR